MASADRDKSPSPTVKEQRGAEDVVALHLRTIEALASAIEGRERTHQHLRRVQVYALEVGKELGLDDYQLEALRIAALLHDVGKLAVPEHIISKPGKLTREEFEKMKIHPVVGAEILERVRFPYPVTPIVRSHHERWDGTGYPDGLKGEQIPIGARVLAAVDCLDALASAFQYRRALPLDEAMEKVASESGISFDPRIVEILSRRYVELEALAQAEEVERANLSTGVKVERGLEPAAEFEYTRRPSPADPSRNFLTSIAAARQEVQNLFELAQDLGNSLSLNETLSLLAIRLKRMIPYDSLAIYVLREDRLRAEYVNGENHRLFSSLEIPLGQGLSGWVAEKRKPIVNGNPSVEPGYLDDETKFTTMRSALAVPLVGLNGTVSVLTLYHSERDAFTMDHLRILLGIVPKLALSIENALRFQRAESSASTDYRTGLPNARSLFLHLDGELVRGSRLNVPVVVIVFEIVNIELVHHRYGHLETTKLLRSVAAKLREFCGERDYVACVSVDEFVFVSRELSRDQIQHKIERLTTLAVEASREINGKETLAMRFGYATYPDDGSDAEQLLSEADRRMQAAITLKVTYRVGEKDEQRPLRVFLCHASSDKAEVRSLCRQLRADGADAWLDEEKLLPGQEWRMEIRNAVRRSDAVLVCLSKNSVTREGFVQAELRYALDIAAEKPEGTIYVIPLLLEPCEVPSGLQQMQWVSKIDPAWYLQLSKALALRASLASTP